MVNVGRVFQFAETESPAGRDAAPQTCRKRPTVFTRWPLSLKAISKHVQFELSNPHESKFALDILRAVCGSDEEIRRRKIASVLYCPVSPLTQDTNMLEAYLELVGYDIRLTSIRCR